jgi:hypothetical protein
MSEDPFYKKCCIVHFPCSGKIQWHHNLIYAGKRQNAKFCILPVCEWVHENATKKIIKEWLDAIMMCRATGEDRLKYPLLKWKK